MRGNFGYFEDDRPGSFSAGAIWKRILVRVRPWWKSVLLAVILSQVVVAAGLAIPWLVKEALDRYITAAGLVPAERISGLLRIAALFCAAAAAGFAANFFQVVVLERCGQEIMHRLRQDLFARIISLGLPFFDRQPVGRLVTRLTNDIQNMHEMFTSVIVTQFNDILRMAAIVVILAAMNPVLAGILLLILPPLFGLAALFGRTARRLFRDIRAAVAALNGFVQECASGMSVIQIFGAEDRVRSRFDELNQDNLVRNLRQIAVFALFMPVNELFATAATAVVIWRGGGRVLEGMMSIGALAAFLHYIRLFFQPVREMSQKYSIVQSAVASAERIFLLLETTQQEPQGGGRVPRSPAGAVEFREVSFAYDGGPEVLRGFSLKIAPGETVAIVGPTGSGKTTVINLLEGFYRPARGAILVDGVAVDELDRAWLRRFIGLVSQETLILPATVRENITLGRDIGEAALARVVEQARLGPLLSRMEKGLDTVVGIGGRVLSAGEEQLIALARALAGDPGILILDEATASIDSATESLIEEAIATTLAGRTAIVIAHRLSTVRRADRIVVMEAGGIAESGSHEDLAAAGGRYAAMLEGERLRD